MATTVTYKGQTLATVENQTKTLQTKGTWCEDDFTLTDVSGGGGGDITAAGILRDLEPSGSVEITLDPEINLPSTVGLSGKPIETLIINGLRSIAGSNGPFRYMKSLRKCVLPDLTATYQGEHFMESFRADGTGICILPSFSGGQYGNFGTNNHVGLIDFGANCTRMMSPYRSLSLNKIILRNSNAVVTLNNVGDLGATPFASNGTGGTLYVPSALISSYQTATNWSTILGYANNSIEDWWVNY